MPPRCGAAARPNTDRISSTSRRGLGQAITVFTIRENNGSSTSRSTPMSWHGGRRRQPRLSWSPSGPVALTMSTCRSPRRITSPGNRSQSLFAYAMTKRMLHVGLLALRKQFGFPHFHCRPIHPRTDRLPQGRAADALHLRPHPQDSSGKTFSEPVVLWGNGYQRGNWSTLMTSSLGPPS